MGVTSRLLRAACAPLLAAALLAGCSGGDGRAATAALTLWSHGGTAGERAALTASIAAFHAAHPEISVSVHIVSEGDYTTQLQEAVARHEVPDVVDVDGPLVASFASQRAFAPLDGLIDAPTLANTTATLRTQGTWSSHFWALGQFDSGLGIWADRAALHRAGVRVPTGVADAWTSAEFAQVLRRLAARDPDHEVLDLRLDYGEGEWLTYGFSPLVASAGGDVAQLGSDPVLRVLQELARWRPYVDPDADGKAFTSRRVPLSWVGHWTYDDYHRALGQDLVLVPLPDLGHGSRTGSGSWAWAVGASSKHRAAAAQLLRWFVQDSEVRRMTEANGALPGTVSALRASRLSDPANPLHLYVLQRDAGAAVPRPVTPSYPLLTATFAHAVHAVLTGTDPATAWAEAARG